MRYLSTQVSHLMSRNTRTSELETGSGGMAYRKQVKLESAGMPTSPTLFARSHFCRPPNWLSRLLLARRSRPLGGGCTHVPGNSLGLAADPGRGVGGRGDLDGARDGGEDEDGGGVEEHCKSCKDGAGKVKSW